MRPTQVETWFVYKVSLHTVLADDTVVSGDNTSALNSAKSNSFICQKNNSIDIIDSCFVLCYVRNVLCF